MMDLSEARRRLEDRREELQSLDAAMADSRRPVELDQSRVGRLSRMDALQDQAMALETERRRGVELKRIEAALARIESGDYGYCLSCDDELLEKRLELDPAATLCVDCVGARQSG